MIAFLFKGLIRDRSKSLFPILVVLGGVSLTVLLFCWMKGVRNDMIASTAHFQTGHAKVMTRPYAAEQDQMPNDLAMLGLDSIMADLSERYPEMVWVARIKFAGLLDIPDAQGETRTQGPVMGMAVDLLRTETEIGKLNLKTALVRGRMPAQRGEILISEDFARKLGIEPGATATLLSSTMYGSQAMTNFTVVGTLRFGITPMDRGAMVAEITDIQAALDMDNAAGEVLGFFRNDLYDDQSASAIASDFNSRFNHSDDEFKPVMYRLTDQQGLADYLGLIDNMMGTVVTVFIIVMSIVLWNAGLIGGIRRYGEIGVRLAMGEHKGHLYRSLIGESLIIGVIGSMLGTAVGVSISYYLQIKGLDITSLMKQSTMMINNVMRARVTPAAFVIGLIPGLLATFLGSSIAGIGIFRRQTSQLFKELEV
jgi:putative ABC transport system permease protein